MRLLITGGAGFLGSHLVERLLRTGARVVVTASSEQTPLRYLGPIAKSVSFLVGDLRSAEHARRAVRGQEIVLHLAGRVGGIGYNTAHPGTIFRENTLLFLHIVEACREESVARLLVTSTACVYPRHCSIPTPEEEGFQGTPEPTNEGYGWAKRMMEFAGAAYAREFGLNVCTARPYNAYGPRDNFDPDSSHVIPALIRRVLSGEDPLVVWGDGTATRSFLYVSDVVEGILAVAERSPQVEAINIGSAEEVSIRDLAGLVVELSGKSVDCVFDSSRPGGQPRRCCDTSLAERLLGFRAQVGLREGIRRTMEWYRSRFQ